MLTVGALGFFGTQYLIDQAKRQNEFDHLERSAQLINDLAKQRDEKPSKIFRDVLEQYPGFIPNYLLMIDSDGQLIGQSHLPPHLHVQDVFSQAPATLLQPKVLDKDENVILAKLDGGDILFRFVRPPKWVYSVSPQLSEKLWQKKGVQITHPVVFGMTPEKANVIIFSIILVIGFLLCVYACAILFRKTAAQAHLVLSQLQSGNLKARFPADSSGYIGPVAGKFNMMADEIESLVLRLKKSEDTRKEMLRSLAHDLKTPVASLKSMLETIRDHRQTMDGKKVSDFIDTCLSEVKYFDDLVQDLLFISGVHEPAYAMQNKKIDLHLMFSSLNKMNVQIDIPKNIFVSGDEHLLRRLFRNGIDNACSFARSQVQIAAKDSGGYWSIEIIDDGPGLDENTLRNFGTRSFSRKIVDEKSGRISIGLGSVIMKKIAEMHHGHVHIENKISGNQILGACLTITLPKA